MEQPILRAKNIRLAVMQKDEIPIARTRLAELERIKKAHDSYLEATQKMRERQAVMQNNPQHFARGWRACLNEFSQAVIDAGREQR
jgi:hypothetical protein